MNTCTIKKHVFCAMQFQTVFLLYINAMVLKSSSFPKTTIVVVIRTENYYYKIFRFHLNLLSC